MGTGAAATGASIDSGFGWPGNAAPLPPPPRAEQVSWVKEAEQLLRVRRYREALGVLNRVVVNEPRDAAAWTLVARAHLGRDENAEALTAALTAARLGADSEPHRLASLALVALERFEEAAEQAAHAVRLDPDDWCNHVEQARALMGMPERIGEARIAVQVAVQLAPHKVIPHLVAGQVEAAAGELELAAKEFRQVFTIDPANPSAYNELARLHLHGAPVRPAQQGARRRRLSGRRSR